MSRRLRLMHRTDDGYSSLRLSGFGNDIPASISVLGDTTVLQQHRLGLICSIQCPGSIILKTYDVIRELRDAGIVDVDYDDFLRSYGVSIPKAEEVDKPAETAYRPELLRFVRKWVYPSNVIDPTDGSATSAVSWSIA